jgi:catechol 2,3-dioxygenase-like lactoylglutathione lyase family enzyme
MQLDHIELLVPDQWEAAEGYGRVLGFSVIQEHIHWADEGGPLMITNDDDQTLLALFRDTPQADSQVVGLGRVAYRVNSDDFMLFLKNSSGWRQPPLAPPDVVDHDKSYSVYLTDPYGNRLEVTSYDYAALCAKLGDK